MALVCLSYWTREPNSKEVEVRSRKWDSNDCWAGNFCKIVSPSAISVRRHGCERLDEGAGTTVRRAIDEHEHPWQDDGLRDAIRCWICHWLCARLSCQYTLLRYRAGTSGIGLASNLYQYTIQDDHEHSSITRWRKVPKAQEREDSNEDPCVPQRDLVSEDSRVHLSVRWIHRMHPQWRGHSWRMQDCNRELFGSIRGKSWNFSWAKVQPLWSWL